MKYASNRPGGINRATISESLQISGIGLHSGKTVNLGLHPAEAGTGLIFRASGNQEGDIKVNPFNVADTQQAVTLGNGNWSISTIEHVMCALAIAGITDLYLEIDAPEIPILDGSAKPFYEAIMATGVSDLGIPVEPIQLAVPTWVVEEDKYIIALPHDGFRVTYGIDFDHPLLRGQSYSEELNSEVFVQELLGARTFGFLKDAEALKAKGLALGASEDNAVILTEDGFVNESLRYQDECVRHKVLDLVGDLYLLGRPLNAHIIASKAGHKLDVALARNVLNALSMNELALKREQNLYNFKIYEKLFR